MMPRPRLAWTAAIIAALVTVAWRVLAFSGFSNDHYVHVARAQQMLLGDWPIRDFVDPGLPLMYVASAVARLISGPALGTELALVAGALAIGLAVLTAVAFLFRHDHGVFVGIASTTFILVHGVQAGRRVMTARLGLFAAATALLLVPWGVYVSRPVGLVSYFTSAFQFAGEENRANVLRTLPPFDWSQGLATAVLRARPPRTRH